MGVAVVMLEPYVLGRKTSVVIRNVSRMCSDARRECGRSKRKSYVLGRKTGVWSFETYVLGDRDSSRCKSNVLRCV